MGAQGNKDQLREGAQGSGVWSSGNPGLLVLPGTVTLLGGARGGGRGLGV